MFLVGQTIGDRYRLDEAIWFGTMSVVYRGFDFLDNHAVVIKVLKEDVTSKRIDDIIRFRHIARKVSNFCHPGLVHVYETGEYKNLHYIVMENLNGQALSEYLHQGDQFVLEEIVGIVRQVAEVLKYVHSQAVIHRDLKPRNILLVEQEPTGKGTVKLLDFGLAQIYDFAQFNSPEAIVGTFGYMSPEQSGIIKRDVDERSDLYSLGIIFYQLLTSVLPFTGEGVGTILHQQIAKQPVQPSLIKDNIPSIIDQIVLKLLKKDPEERYQSADGLIADLDKFTQGESSFILGQGDSRKKLKSRIRLVGRESELHKLKEVYDLARQGRGSVCLVSAEAGGGKSRLIEEFRNWVFEQGGEFFWGSCFDRSNHVPYQPFAEVLKTLVSTTGKMSQQDRQDRLARMKDSLGNLGGIITGLAPEMKEIIGTVSPIVPLEPERDNLRFLKVCSQFFLDLGEVEKPAVIMLDDLHWADEGSLSLLRAILIFIEKYPVVVIGTYRDDEIAPTHRIHGIINEAREQKLPLEEIKLQKFDLSAVGHMISELLVEEEDDICHLSEYVFKKTQGNPFFVIEIIRQLVYEKAIYFMDGHYVADWQAIANITVPSTLVDTIIKKIEDLEPRLLELLSYGAVLGREFDTDFLLKLGKYSIDELVEMIDQATMMQLVESGSGSGKIAFIHDRVREAFYQRLSKDELKKLHFEIAFVMEQIYSQNSDAVIYELAAHFAVTGDNDKTLQYSLVAAEKAKNGYANAEAENNYNMAIKALENKQEIGSALWQKAKEGLMESYLLTGKFSQVIDIANEILPYKTNNVEKAGIHRQIATAYFKSGDLSNAEQIVSRGLAMLGEYVPKTRAGIRFSLVKEIFVQTLHESFPRVFLHKQGQPVKPEHREILKFNFTMGWIYALTDAEKFAWSVLKILNINEAKIGDPRELARGKGAFGSINMAISKFDKAVLYLQESIKLLEEMKDEWGLAQCYQWMGFGYLWQGKHEQSTHYFLRSKEIFERLGDSWEQIYSLLGLGSAYRYMADYEKSLFYYSECLHLSDQIKSYMEVSSAMSNIAYLHIIKGDLDQARKWQDKALSLSEKKNIKTAKCTAKINIGYLQLRSGEYEQAIINLTEAKNIYLEQTSVKDTMVRLFNYLAEACVERLKTLNRADKGLVKLEQKMTRKACVEALKNTRLWPNHYGAALRITGKYYAWIKKYRKAEKYFQESISHCKKINLRAETAKGYMEYGLLLHELNRHQEAQKYWVEANNVFREIGLMQYVAIMQRLLNGNNEPWETDQWQTPLTTDNYADSRSDYKPMEKLGVNSFKTLSSYLQSIQDTNSLPEKILDFALELTGAERGCLMLYPESQRSPKSLEVKIYRNLDQQDLDENLHLSRTIIKRVEETMQPEIVYDAGADDKLKAEMSVVLYELRSIMCYPLIAREKMLGLVYLDNRLVGGLFTHEKLDLLKPFFAQAALVIDNARLSSSLRKMAEVKKGYVQEPAFDLKSRSVLANKFGTFYNLTNRERQILLLLFEGTKNDLIQEKLHISGNTLKTHLKNIYSKLKINSRKELLNLFMKFIEQDRITGTS